MRARPHASGRKVSRSELVTLLLSGLLAERFARTNRWYYPTLVGPSVLLLGFAAAAGALATVMNPTISSSFGAPANAIAFAALSLGMGALLLVPQSMKVGVLTAFHLIMGLGATAMVLSATPSSAAESVVHVGIVLIGLMMPITWTLLLWSTKGRTCGWDQLPVVIADHRALGVAWNLFGVIVLIVGVGDVALMVAGYFAHDRQTALSSLSFLAYGVGNIGVGMGALSVARQAAITLRPVQG